MSPEIPFNNDPWSNFSNTRPELIKMVLRESFDLDGITPLTHPKVCDLCSGEGAIAGFLVTEFGWKPENITCIDRYRPRKPLVENANWQYLDLVSAGRNTDLILPLNGQFDLVTVFYPDGPGPQTLKILADFLLAGEGNVENEVCDWIFYRNKNIHDILV